MLDLCACVPFASGVGRVAVVPVEGSVWVVRPFFAFVVCLWHREAR